MSKSQPSSSIKFILLHTKDNRTEADTYGRAVMQGIHRMGYQAELVQACIGSFDNIPVVETQTSHMFAGFLTSSIISKNALPAIQDEDVAEMLYFMRAIVRRQPVNLSIKIIVFGHGYAFQILRLAQRLELAVEEELKMCTIICVLALDSIDHPLWANWSVQLVHSWARVPNSPVSPEEELETIRNSWFETDGLFLDTCLWYFADWLPPLLLMPSLWSIRPLGRSLPDIASSCDCNAKPRAATRKHWKVAHNAEQGRSASDVLLDIECSACKRWWKLRDRKMAGVLREYMGRFAVESKLILLE